MLFTHMSKTAMALALFAITGTAVVALTFSLTKDLIAENERQAIMLSLNALVPATQHDNDMFNDTIQLTDPKLLGSKGAVTVYRARQENMPIAAVFESIAPDGYNGRIKLLIAIHEDGTVAGVRVVSHKETPGLGDSIEHNRSNWILFFDGRSLFNPTKAGWRVKKDGGIFDQFTGATITPRAIVKAVYNSLIYFSLNKDRVFTENSTPTKTEGTKHE